MWSCFPSTATPQELSQKGHQESAFFRVVFWATSVLQGFFRSYITLPNLNIELGTCDLTQNKFFLHFSYLALKFSPSLQTISNDLQLQSLFYSSQEPIYYTHNFSNGSPFQENLKRSYWCVTLVMHSEGCSGRWKKKN